MYPSILNSIEQTKHIQNQENSPPETTRFSLPPVDHPQPTQNTQAEDAGPIEGFARVVRDLRELTAPGSVVADRVTIVHGDFRIDNLVFHPAEPRVIAVLDWELSTLGHPLADLANLCILHHLPASAAALASVPALPSRDPGARRSGVQVGGAHRSREPTAAVSATASSPPSPPQTAPSPLAGLKGLDLDALGIPQQPELMDAYRRAAAAAAATAAVASPGGIGDPESPLAGVAGPGVAELGLAFVFFKMAVIAHGVKARQSRGVASSAQASLVSVMVPAMVALATEQISKLRAVKAGEELGGGDGGGGGEKGGAPRRCNLSAPLPPPKAVLFDVGGVLSGSPLLAIAEFERDTKPSLPPSYVGVAIAAAGEEGLFQRLERGEVRLGSRFLERFAEYLCSERAKRAYVNWYVSRRTAGKGKGRRRGRPLSPPTSSTTASRPGDELKTSNHLRAATDVINRSECGGESSNYSSSSSSSSSSVRGEATAAVASVVAVDVLELFRRIAEAARVPVPEMFAAAEALRRQGFKVGVVSNDFLVEPGFVLGRRRRSCELSEHEKETPAAESATRLSELPVASEGSGISSSNGGGGGGIGGNVYSRLPALCDAVVLSSRSRCRKPGDAIYRRACDELGISASEAVFVDDIRVNIQAAGALGMRTVWVEPGGSVDAAVSELEAATGVKLTAALAEAGAGVRHPAGKL